MVLKLFIILFSFLKKFYTKNLNPYIGYNKSALIAKEMKESGKDIFSVNSKLKLIEPEKLKKILAPQNLLKMGFTLKDILHY